MCYDKSKHIKLQFAEGEDDIAFDFHEANEPTKPTKLDPKVTAKELTVEMYKHIFNIDSGSNVGHDGKRLIAAKQCAQVCVQQIIKSIKFADYKVWNNDPMNLGFWQQVKDEIQSLA